MTLLLFLFILQMKKGLYDSLSTLLPSLSNNFGIHWHLIEPKNTKENWFPVIINCQE